MKFTAFVTLLCLSSCWGVKETSEKPEDPKGKREVAVGYPTSNSYQTPSLNQDDGSAVSIGAGYSIGAKPNFGYGEQGSGAALQLSSEGLPSSGHATIQLAPITLQPNHGSLASSDLSQLMSQISQGLNSGAISLQSTGGHEGLYQVGGGQAGHNGQELSFPQFGYSAPKLQQYAFLEQPQGGLPSYAIGSKGLSTYTSNGPVLFNPSEAHGSQPLFNVAQIAQSFSDAGSIPLGDSGHAFPGHSFGGHLKAGSSYATPSKTSFKPSAFLGSSIQGDSNHGLSAAYNSPAYSGIHGLPTSHSALSFGPGSHGLASYPSFASYGGGPSKQIAASYLPAKSEGFGSSAKSLAALSAGSTGHPSSLSGNSYGAPSGPYHATATHAASSTMPQYYLAPKHLSSGGFGEGSSSYRAHGHGPLSAFSSVPKYSFGGHGRPGSSSTRYAAPKDSHGAYSETTYNTIKYSEELKPNTH